MPLLDGTLSNKSHDSEFEIVDSVSATESKFIEVYEHHEPMGIHKAYHRFGSLQSDSELLYSLCNHPLSKAQGHNVD